MYRAAFEWTRAAHSRTAGVGGDRRGGVRDPRGRRKRHFHRSADPAELVHSLLDRAPPPASIASKLSEREAEVLRLAAQGNANKEIAAMMNLGVKTVETYEARAMEKFGLKSRVDIVRLGAQRSWFHM